jgi:hypothetical protein
MKTRRILTTLALGAALLAAVAVPAYAGSPHFVDDQLTATRTADTLTVSGKEAGLGDETQIHVVLTATASCVNPGGNKPQAANKESVSAAGDFPVQSGKADFELSVTATFQPPCSPPMTIVYSDVTVTDTTNGISATLSGLF